MKRYLLAIMLILGFLNLRASNNRLESIILSMTGPGRIPNTLKATMNSLRSYFFKSKTPQ